MEDNNNKKGKKSVVNVSVVLSFAVAIFAIFSLVMADLSLGQRSNVSYAAPDTLPSSFTFNTGDGLIGSGLDGNNINRTFGTRMYMANNDPDTPVFCVEHANDNINNNETYTSDVDIEDYGLLYLLNSSSANGIQISDVTGEEGKYVDSWITQVAIWVYLYEKNGGSNIETTSPHYISPDELLAIKSANKIVRRIGGDPGNVVNVYGADGNGDNLYDRYVSVLVTNALKASSLVKLDVTLENKEISTTEKKDFYYSAPIRVTGSPSSALKSYTVSLNGVDGAVAVDKDLEELPGVVTNPGVNSEFYVRIPADKITKEIQKVTVSVNGTFDTLEGKYYVGTGDLQKVVTVKAGEKTISDGTEVEFYGSDDTGMSTAQTIYFIGLIVLLCGVGIVYANAKPVQVKQ